jgi:CheY-like chemotaxis protein
LARGEARTLAPTVAAVTDFFFATKLKEAAKAQGAEVVFATSLEDVVAKVASAGAGLVLLDLDGRDYSRIDTLRALKADPRTRGAKTVGYLPHVRADLKAQAEAAGCQRVLARSAFVKLLPDLLKEG